MIKSLVKQTPLWKRIVDSDLYQKRNFPDDYNRRRNELIFYKRFLQMYPGKNKLIFDVGANVGHKSFIFSKLAKKVIAFEPSGELFQTLSRRFEKTNVIVYNYALGSSVSRSKFYIVEGNEAYNSLNKKHIETTAASRGIATMKSVKIEEIQVEIIENVISDWGIPKYIKIDVEGYELEIIKNLTTPIPLLSFEANLPEFLRESIKSLNHLEGISLNRYTFNFSTDNSFLMERFISKDQAVKFLSETELPYLEIFARLHPEF